MNLDEINQHLANLVNSGDQQFANAASFVQQVIQQLHTGQMSGSEAQEVLQAHRQPERAPENVSPVAKGRRRIGLKKTKKRLIAKKSER